MPVGRVERGNGHRHRVTLDRAVMDEELHHIGARRIERELRRDRGGMLYDGATGRRFARQTPAIGHGIPIDITRRRAIENDGIAILIRLIATDLPLLDSERNRSGVIPRIHRPDNTDPWKTTQPILRLSLNPREVMLAPQIYGI